MKRVRNNLPLDLSKLLENSDLPVETDGLTPMGDGFSSHVYATHRHVVKFLKRAHLTETAAEAQVNILRGEQQSLADFLDERTIAIARFTLVRSVVDNFHVVMVQDRIDGTTIGEVLGSGLSTDMLAEYFERSLLMHEKTRTIPDLACVERGFNPFNDPNTRVVAEDGIATPVLVDTTFGRVQRHPIAGRVINRGIAFGVKRALGQLS